AGDFLWIHPRPHVGTTWGPRESAARRVDHRGAARRRVQERIARGVDVDDVVPADGHLNREPAAGIGEAAERPAARERAVAGYGVDRAQVERVAHVEVVVA